jgi:hypothetical protein
MGTSRIAPNILSAAARPIGVAEFATALSKILKVSQVGCHGQPIAIGIFKLYFITTRSCYEVAANIYPRASC